VREAIDEHGDQVAKVQAKHTEEDIELKADQDEVPADHFDVPQLPRPDAVDFSGEQEQIEELEQQAHSVFGAPPTTKSLLDDSDDSDDDDDYDEALTTAAPAATPKKSAVQVALEDETKKRQQMLLDPQRITQDIRAATTQGSAVDGFDMLRMTELFAAPDRSKEAAKSKQPRRKLPLKVARQNAEHDEEVDYHAKEQASYQEGTQGSLFGATAAAVEMPALRRGMDPGPNEVGQQMIGMEGAGRKEVLVEAERRRQHLLGLTNVEQRPWEDDVNWKGGDHAEQVNKKADITPGLPNYYKSPWRPLVLRPGRFEYGAVEAVANGPAEYDEAKKQAQASLQRGKLAAEVPQRHVVDDEELTVSEECVEMLDRIREQVGHVNVDLEDPDTWADDVVWEDRGVARRTPLVWDTNDKRMNFTEQAPPISKTRRANSDSALGWMNVSADAAYKEVKVEGKNKTSKLTDSVRCLNSIMASRMEFHNLTFDADDNFETEERTHEDYLAGWHRPGLTPLAKKSGKCIKFKKGKPDKIDGGGHGQNSLKEKAQHTLQTAQFLVAEYHEAHPVLLCNMGMGARLLHYRAKTPTEVATGEDRNVPVLDEGEFVSFDPETAVKAEAPLLPRFEAGEEQTVLRTNMSRAPAFRQQAATTDFIVVRHGKRKATIREIPVIYTIGTVEALQDVPAPNSKPAGLVRRKNIEIWAKEMLGMPRNDGMRSCITVQDVADRFPTAAYTHQIIRTELNTFARAGGNNWFAIEGVLIEKKNELRDVNRKVWNPERQAAYESMRAANQRLKRAGVNRIHLLDPVNSISIPSAVNQLGQDEKTQLHGEKIVELLSSMPWWVSQVQREAILEKIGSKPLERLRSAQVRSNDPWGFLDDNGGKRSRSLPRPGVEVGKDVGLEKLTMSQTFQKLEEVGVGKDDMKGLTRWDRIALLRRIFNATVGEGKLKRGKTNKISVAVMSEMQRHELQSAWYNQRAHLSDPNEPAFSSDEEEDEEEEMDEEMADLANLMDAGLEEAEAPKKKKKKSREEDEEYNQDMRTFLDGVEEDDEEESLAERQNLALNLNPPETPKSGGISWKDPSSGKKFRVLIRKRTTVTNTDGTTSLKWEFSTDPKKVREEMAKQSTGDSAKAKSGRGGRRSRGADGDAPLAQRGGAGVSGARVSMGRGATRGYNAARGDVAGGRKRKRSLYEPEDEYVAPKAANRSRRMNNNPQLVLCEYLTKVVDAMYRFPGADAFAYAVDTKKMPDYLPKIKENGSEPICINEMREKCKLSSYRQSHECRDEMDRLVRNSEIYNGIDSPFTKIVRNAMEAGLREWEKHSDEIVQVDATIEAGA